VYKICKKPYGFHLTFSGLIGVDEMEAWLAELKEVLATADEKFGMFVDMRDLEILPPESQPALKRGQRLSKKLGQVRSVVILSDEITTMQFKRIAKQTGIYEWERFIDAATEPNWEEIGLAWVIEGVDPDKRRTVMPKRNTVRKSQKSS